MTRPRATFPLHDHRTQAQVRLDERTPAERLRDKKIYDMTKHGVERTLIAERMGLSTSTISRRRHALGLT